jgi:hypothetical protein
MLSRYEGTPVRDVLRMTEKELRKKGLLLGAHHEEEAAPTAPGMKPASNIVGSDSVILDMPNQQDVTYCDCLKGMDGGVYTSSPEYKNCLKTIRSASSRALLHTILYDAPQGQHHPSASALGQLCRRLAVLSPALPMLSPMPPTRLAVLSTVLQQVGDTLHRSRHAHT